MMIFDINLIEFAEVNNVILTDNYTGRNAWVIKGSLKNGTKFVAEFKNRKQAIKQLKTIVDIKIKKDEKMMLINDI